MTEPLRDPRQEIDTAVRRGWRRPADRGCQRGRRGLWGERVTQMVATMLATGRHALESEVGVEGGVRVQVQVLHADEVAGEEEWAGITRKPDARRALNVSRDDS
jgi:hypothetical protein